MLKFPNYNCRSPTARNMDCNNPSVYDFSGKKMFTFLGTEAGSWEEHWENYKLKNQRSVHYTLVRTVVAQSVVSQLGQRDHPDRLETGSRRSDLEGKMGHTGV